MKKLDITAITNSSRLPIKKGTLQFLQDAPKEIVASVVTSLIGSSYSSSVVYILAGGINSGTYPTYSITAGKVFYNGEIYDLQAASFSATGSNVAVFSFLQTQYTIDADPVTFTDSVVRNIHNIQTFQLIQGASGSGIVDYTQAFFLSFTIPKQIVLTAPAGIVGGVDYTGNQLQLIGVYPNIIGFVPPLGNLAPVIFKGSYNVGDIPPSSGGGGAYNVTFGSTLSTASYFVMGSIFSNGSPAYDSTLTWSWHNPTTTGFTLNIQEWIGGVQNVAFKFLVFAI